MSSEYHYPQTLVDDTIDLRPYIMSLFRYWPVMVLLPLLAGVLAYALTARGDDQYETRVSVAIVRYQTDFDLEPTLKTVTDAGALRLALADLARNGAIAEAVIDELGDLLPELYRDPVTLTEMVSAEALRGDLIEIAVTGDDPDVVVLVARAWAGAYERHINEVFEVTSTSAVEPFDEQMALANAEYGAAQQALASRISESRIAQLEREVSERQDVLDALLLGDRQAITDLVSRQLALRALLDDAQALLAAVEGAPDGAADSNAVAILLFKARVFGTPSAFTLQYDPNGPGEPADARGQAADLRSLVASLSASLADVDRAISENAARPRGLPAAQVAEMPAAESPATIAQAVQTLESEIRALKSELESARATDRELTRARDLAWETYTALSRKAAEQRIESQLRRSTVRVASQPLRPKDPVSRPYLQNLGLAGVGGLSLAVLLVFMVTYLRPAVAPEPPQAPAPRETGASDVPEVAA